MGDMSRALPENSGESATKHSLARYALRLPVFRGKTPLSLLSNLGLRILCRMLPLFAGRQTG
jgi:hypothetical protein